MCRISVALNLFSLFLLFIYLKTYPPDIYPLAVKS